MVSLVPCDFYVRFRSWFGNLWWSTHLLVVLISLFYIITTESITYVLFLCCSLPCQHIHHQHAGWSLVNICVCRFIASLFLSYLKFLPRNNDIHSFISLTYLRRFHDLNSRTAIYQGRSTSIRIIDNWDTWSFAWFELFVSCKSLSDTTFFKYPHFICKFSCIGNLCFLITDCCGCQRGPQICGPCLPCSAKGSCSYKTAIPA